MTIIFQIIHPMSKQFVWNFAEERKKERKKQGEKEREKERKKETDKERK